MKEIIVAAIAIAVKKQRKVTKVKTKMTVNEVIKVLDRMANDFTTWKEETEALDLAIRSVKAWDEVIAEIKRYRSDCELACSSMDDDGICEGCNKVFFDSIERIIVKHVKEVYNEST